MKPLDREKRGRLLLSRVSQGGRHVRGALAREYSTHARTAPSRRAEPGRVGTRRWIYRGDGYTGEGKTNTAAWQRRPQRHAAGGTRRLPVSSAASATRVIRGARWRLPLSSARPRLRASRSQADSVRPPRHEPPHATPSRPKPLIKNQNFAEGILAGTHAALVVAELLEWAGDREASPQRVHRP